MVLDKLRSPLLCLISLLSYSTAAYAHEFWLEPLNFQVAEGSNVQAHIKVGEGLEGDTYAFYPSRFERFDLTVADATTPLKNRFAQEPAVDQPTRQSGLHILTHQSKSSRLRYQERAVFEKFLKAEGIEWVLEAHEKRGIPNLDFTELYKRYAKTLVKVGDGAGKDKFMGLPFEWVVLTNPYTLKDRSDINAQLLFQGKPFPNSLVNVFNRQGGSVKQTKLTTDAEGRVLIPTSEGGVFLINAVHMVDPNAFLAKSVKAQWMSLWASTTFEVK